MNVLEYIYYRMYKAYLEKDDSPLLSSFMYMSLVLFIITVVTLMFIEKFLMNIELIDGDKAKTEPLYWITIVIGVVVTTYLRYSRKSYSDYESKYASHNVLNASIRIWMLILLPFLILFIGTFSYVVLFGGVILGKETSGLWPSN